MEYWINSHQSHLNLIGNQDAESNHSSHYEIMSFGGFVQPTELVVQFLWRSKDAAKELNINQWETWIEAL